MTYMEVPKYINKIVDEAVEKDKTRREVINEINEAAFDNGDNPDDFRAKALERFEAKGGDTPGEPKNKSRSRKSSDGDFGVGTGLGFGTSGDPDSDFL
jgi:hypothetical protein